MYPSLPASTNEPTVGVIDTIHRKVDYFEKWVELENDFDEAFDNGEHGNKVTSIIVSGPEYNPQLQDNCGLFKVHHFGISRSGRESSFRLVKRIKEIVESHPEIHVWNLSLGSPYSSSINRISHEAAVLDQLQYDNPNILFIIAGTNLDQESKSKDKKFNRIGAPADSINSIVVNSVNGEGKITSYGRKGLALHDFVKPDVCYY